MTSLTSIIIGALFVRATHSAGADANVNDDQPWNARSTGLQKLLNASPTLDNAPETFLGNIQGSRWTNATILPHQFPPVLMNCQLGSNGLCVDDHALYLHKDQPVYSDIGNHYEILEMLGEGSFGVVHAARDLRTGEAVACKSIKKRGVNHRGTRIKEIQEEIRFMLTAGGHENIVKFKAAFQNETHVQIVIDLCPGGNLLDWLEEHGPLDERTAARFMVQMAGTIQHFHGLGILHRDIKPSNFLLTSEDINLANVKIGDFGLSKVCKDGEDFPSDHAGTKHYLAPEQIQGNYDRTADMWSLGVTLYECLSKWMPFVKGGADKFETVHDAIWQGHLDLHNGIWKNISSSAKDLIISLLHRMPSHRATPEDVLSHPWICEQLNICTKNETVSDEVVQGLV